MKKNKLILISAAAFMALSPLAFYGSNPVQAADTNVTNKIIMHTAVAYDKDGNSTGVKYNAFTYAKLVANPVSINGSLYYKVADKDQYLKATNIDGVTRTITHNTYIYSTSTRRTSYQNKWKLYKGQTITTYGGSYKFKNGKHYFRVGGPSKQYVKSYNLGQVVKVNTVMNPNSTTNNSGNTNTNSSEETTVTVTAKTADLYVEVPDKDAVQPSGKTAKMGDKFVVDRLEQGTRANTGQEGDDDWELEIYHIKGTNYWIYNRDVKAAKDIPVQNYFKTKSSRIKFTQDTDVYNADGTVQNHNGAKIRKQGAPFKVDKLIYIWVPSENKAELFYHLVENTFSATGTTSSINVGNNAYVKANDVQFYTDSVALTPSNTPEQAKAATQK
ncbi:SLAP domain-containing protein [Lactobacillus kalixensis]|uniref:Surface layer protein n=1 Tax=Lactobacillus kalixensis DSM 16043 TaxID=1423763 RepID=A0A0R1U8V4_9LACO|nr:SLAP domain-containing protein [Lactobacillus kalixensis]KRL89687.1 surface layer protein [Lactobacillus kalixensis DSM 16043]